MSEDTEDQILKLIQRITSEHLDRYSSFLGKLDLLYDKRNYLERQEQQKTQNQMSQDPRVQDLVRNLTCHVNALLIKNENVKYALGYIASNVTDFDLKKLKNVVSNMDLMPNDSVFEIAPLYCKIYKQYLALQKDQHQTQRDEPLAKDQLEINFDDL